ncbi:MAG: thioredoxin-disulfide reductase [Candidatus Eisenbacteria bacterium]|nr:thioredoxin-disulfide reductase [Candidatus Eisenbacteria bacterium]
MEQHDIVIVGAGPAGLTVGLNTSRARLSSLVIEMMTPGGWAATTELIENYPGVGPVNGSELGARMLEQAQSFGTEYAQDEVTSIEKTDGGFIVHGRGDDYPGKLVVVAVGSNYRKLGVPGEEELLGRGVSYCATCDGPFYKDRTIAVVGGGDSALQEALYLTRFAGKIHLIHRRDEFRAIEVLAERVRAHEKIECVMSHTVKSINGETGVESVTLNDLKAGETRDLPVEGVFLFVGLEPKTDFLKGLLELDERGYIITDDDMKTNVRGILAAGDCRAKTLRQIATAVGDASTAAFVAQQFVEDGVW